MTVAASRLLPLRLDIAGELLETALAVFGILATVKLLDPGSDLMPKPLSSLQEPQSDP